MSGYKVTMQEGDKEVTLNNGRYTGGADSEGNNEMRESIARAKEVIDSGKHYRWKYKGLKLDAYRIAEIVGLKDNALFSALKKILAAGERGGKDYVQDIIEARDALNRKLEMIEEDLE